MMNDSFDAMICDFAKKHPDVRLQVHFSTRHVDLLRDGYDVAIRAGTEISPGLVARTLARDPVLAVASPEYLAEKGTPRTRRDLRHHRCLMGFSRDELPQTHWLAPGSGKLHIDGTFASNAITLLCEAALRGLGIAFLPRLVVRPFLENGELVQVLAGIVGADSRIAVVYPEREFVPAHVRAFIDVVTAWGTEEYAKGLPARCDEAARKRARPIDAKTGVRPAARGAKKRARTTRRDRAAV